LPEFIITCCSTVDLPYEYLQNRNIPFVSFHFHMDGKDYSDDLGRSMPLDKFYQRIAAGAMPTTSQVSVGEYIAFFEPFLRAGQDILHISLSSGLSGSFQSAVIARHELAQKYPHRNITIVDSLSASSGYGLLVDMSADLRDQSATLEQVRSWVEENKLYLHHWFFSTDLTHYKRGGRLSAASALMGTLLHICPLMNMNDEGRLIPRSKIRGKQHVMDEMVHMMEAHARDGMNYSGKCFISHSACADDARSVAHLVELKFTKLSGKVMINSVGTVIGSHTGPGTVALFFLGDRRTA
jgi:DegV family protein with EDD domain